MLVEEPRRTRQPHPPLVPAVPTRTQYCLVPAPASPTPRSASRCADRLSSRGPAAHNGTTCKPCASGARRIPGTCCSSRSAAQHQDPLTDVLRCVPCAGPTHAPAAPGKPARQSSVRSRGSRLSWSDQNRPADIVVASHCTPTNTHKRPTNAHTQRN